MSSSGCRIPRFWNLCARTAPGSGDSSRRSRAARDAAEHLMLRRTPEQVALAIDDFVVAVDERGRIAACGALKEYSPSVAEVAAIAVAPEAQGNGLGREIVSAIESLAMKRGVMHVFA